MPVIAIAGGTGGVGRAILEVLKKHAEYTGIILSRNIFDLEKEGTPAKTNWIKQPQKSTDLETELGAKIVKTNYDDEDGMVKILEDNNVEVVISTMPVYSEAQRDIQIRLVHAADRAKNTKRFVPSDFSYPEVPDRGNHPPVIGWKKAIVDACRNSKTPLEYSSFKQGFFMDYFGMPNTHSYLKRIVIGVDVLNNAAAIPGDGNSGLVFTNSFDVAEVIVHCLSKPPGTWKEVVEVYGDKMSFNRMVEVLEEIKGVKFDVKHDSLEDVKNKKATLLPFYKEMGEARQQAYRNSISVVGPSMVDGTFDIDIEARATKDDYPEGFVPKKIEDFLKECWGQEEKKG